MRIAMVPEVPGPERARREERGEEMRNGSGPSIRAQRAAAAGFSLLEVLLVVAILLILFTLGATQINQTAKRGKLIGASNGIMGVAQQAVPLMQRRGHPMFVRIGARAADNTRPVELWEDTNNNLTLQDSGGVDTLITTFTIPDYISLSRTDVTAIQQTGWDDAGGGKIILGIDFLGRTFAPSTGRQISAVATLTVTHEGMVTGGLSPMLDYQLRINPLWYPTTSRLVQGVDF